MDAYQQPHHRYMRPPPAPPSTSDPHYQYHNHQQQPLVRPTPVPPPQGQTWYSDQFQYPKSPSPPPPPQHHWDPPPPPPHADHLPQPYSSAYPPAPPPYLAHPHHQPTFSANNNNSNSQFPPPPGHPRPPFLPHSQIAQPYPQVNQEWSNPNWGHRQAWDYPAHNNVEDWGARAREWAAAKTAMEDQGPQSQFTSAGRPEEQNRFHDQYPQSVDSHYPDFQQQSHPGSSYQQFPVPSAPAHRQPIVYPQEIASVSSGPSYVPDGHLPYPVRYGSSAGDFSGGFSHQESSSTSSSVHQQEVPSSYSSVTGKEETADEKEKSYKSLPLSISSGQEGQHYMHPSFPVASRSIPIEQTYTFGNQATDPAGNDQPLDFAPRFNPEHDPHMQSSYAVHQESVGTVRSIDPVAAVPSINSWTPPLAAGVVYPSISSAIPSGPQHDASIAVPSAVSGHDAPPFGRFHGPNFPSAGAPFGLSAGPAVHHAAAFPGDTYGLSSVSDRPKKASVPNWLKEEIIKNKAAITKTSLEHPKEETRSIEDEGVDKSFGKGDQADSKSIDSSRSIGEEEDDDEDYVENARNAAINLEIKRVLTEVLLKVTDELFDEIATKVLSEDDMMVEDDHDAITSNHKVLSPSSVVPTHKASAKILVPVEAKQSLAEVVNERSSSSAPGDLLGLANYASDDDDDDDDGNGEMQSSNVTNSRNNAILQQSSVKKLSEDMHDAAENGSSKVEYEEHGSVKTNMDTDLSKTSAFVPKKDKSVAYSSKVAYGDRDDEVNAQSGKVLDRTNGSGLNDTLGDKLIMKAELPFGSVSEKNSTTEENQGKETGMKLGKNDQHESKGSSAKDFDKDVDISRSRADENHRRQDDRHLRKEKTDNQNSSKEKTKEQGIKPGEKAKESESRKRSSHLEVKEDRKDAERFHRTCAREDTDRKRERIKEEDRSRHKLASDSSGHKRRRSSSISSRGRNSKDNSVSHDNGSNDETSNDSKRKPHSRKRTLSPSPVRSRRRQVSRSPHSKHSQRRHSPYSSLESTRGRRSRSRSPVRRQR